MAEQPCSERVHDHWASRRDDLEHLLDGVDPETGEESEEATLAEYGLAFDYVPRGTFADQEIGYFRYQLSWGGPSDELRFFVHDVDWRLQSAEYWFMDWFDGAKIDVSDSDTVEKVWDWFSEIDAPENAVEQAR